MFVIAGGNAFDGLVLHGPFDDMEAAHAWAERNLDEWWCVLLNPPQDPTDVDGGEPFNMSPR